MCVCNDILIRQYLIKATVPLVYVVTRVESCSGKCLRRLLRSVYWSPEDRIKRGNKRGKQA